MSKRNTSLVAVGLEVAPGTFLGTFGIGHLYQGRIGAGLAFMVSYWVLQSINAWLVGLGGIGLLTGFLTWMAYAFIASTDVLRE